MGARRAAFWGAVAGVAVLAPFTLQVVVHRWPQLGLAKFVNFTYAGGNTP